MFGRNDLSQMKIGFVLPASAGLSARGNGVRNQALGWAEELIKCGDSVAFVSPWDATESKAFDVVHIMQAGLQHGIELTEVRRVAKKIAISPIIDSNVPNGLYRLAARVGRVNSRILTVPGVIQRQLEQADLVVCRSSHEVRRVIRGLGVDRRKVVMVLNGAADAQRQGWQDFSQEQEKREKRYVLHVSAYTQKRKNVARLIEAVGPVGVPLIIAGEAVSGEELDHLERLARRYSSVELRGFQSVAELQELYAGAKVFCLPSWHEGTGLAALEAARYGATVVITNRGGAMDYFGDAAVYVDPSNIDDIRSSVLEAWRRDNDGRLVRHLSQNCSWLKSVQQLRRAYLDCG